MKLNVCSPCGFVSVLPAARVGEIGAGYICSPLCCIILFYTKKGEQIIKVNINPTAIIEHNIRCGSSSAVVHLFLLLSLEEYDYKPHTSMATDCMKRPTHVIWRCRSSLLYTRLQGPPITRCRQPQPNNSVRGKKNACTREQLTHHRNCLFTFRNLNLGHFLIYIKNKKERKKKRINRNRKLHALVFVVAYFVFSYTVHCFMLTQ